MSVVLLDTHALIWLTEGDKSLGEKSRQIANSAANKGLLVVSAITFWEVAMLHKKGRITLKQPVNIWREKIFAMRIEEIPVSGDIGIKSTQLEQMNNDPADRMIVATTLIHKGKLITADDDILQWIGCLDRYDARK